MKFSQYDYAAFCKDESVVLVNTFNSRYVKFNKKEELEHFVKLYNFEMPLDENDDMVKSLYNKGFIVDDNIDEYAIAKKDIQEYLSKNDKKFELVLYVTDQCNFRCVYCPVSYKNEKFSNENWEALYKHIEKGIISGLYEIIDISFFGGEPLLEIDNILSFLKNLDILAKKYTHVIFRHQITTNAYFLTPEIYDKLVKYNVLYYQITVDGFAETHNKMRPLVGGQGTWDIIIENLKYINTKYDNAQIVLRANYNKTNLDTLEKYKEWQQRTFKNPKFTFFYHPVVSFSNNVPEEQLADTDSKEVKEVEAKIKNGMNVFKKYSGICHVNFKHCYTISVDGNISKCDNLHGSRKNIYVGKLSQNGDFIFDEDIKAWQEDFELEDCKKCFIYPLCCARTCPLKKVKYPEERFDCIMVKEKWVNGIKYFLENDI